MAGISDDPSGRKRILFIGADGKRRTIRLGKASTKQAEAFKVKVESLVTAAVTGSMDDEVSRWLAALDGPMRLRLGRAGLARKPGTATTYRQTRRTLLDHFGPSKRVRDVDALDAEQWRQYLKTSKANRTGGTDELSEPTISKRVKTARQIFARAVDWGCARRTPSARSGPGRSRTATGCTSSAGPMHRRCSTPARTPSGG